MMKISFKKAGAQIFTSEEFYKIFYYKADVQTKYTYYILSGLLDGYKNLHTRYNFVLEKTR